MNKSILTMFLACFLLVPGYLNATENTKNLFIIVTTDDPITQLMSMVLATQSWKKGAHVQMLLCGEAGSLAIKNSQETLLKPHNKSPKMLMKKLIHDGVKVEICPPYLPNKEKSPSQLIEGVAVAKPPLVAEKLIDENTNILSY